MIIDKIVHKGAILSGFSASELIEMGVSEDQVELEIKKQELARTYIKRLDLYKQESDPLYMEWQYDKTPESEKAWRDKVAEIKQSFPLPEAI